MEIKTTAWHFRWIKRWGFAHVYPNHIYAPKSLCTYFWTLVLTLFASALLLLIVLGVVVTLAAAAITHTHEALIIGGCCIGLAALLVLMFWRADAIQNWMDAWIDKRVEKNIAKRGQPKEPNLLWEFIKAKKRKVCPLIEYK